MSSIDDAFRRLTPAKGTLGRIRPSLKTYVSLPRRLAETLQKLQNLDIEAVVSRPTIAVIGNMGAGKTSLVEALCGVKLLCDLDSYRLHSRCAVEVILRT